MTVICLTIIITKQLRNNTQNCGKCDGTQGMYYFDAAVLIGRITSPVCPSVRLSRIYGLLTRKQKDVEKIGVNVHQGRSNGEANFGSKCQRSNLGL